MFLVLFLYTIVFAYYLLCLHSWPAVCVQFQPLIELFPNSLYRWETRAKHHCKCRRSPQFEFIARGERRTKIFRLLDHHNTFKSWHCKIANIEYNFGWLRLVFSCVAPSQAFSNSFDGILRQSNHRRQGKARRGFRLKWFFGGER